MSANDPTAGGLSRELFAQVRELFAAACELPPEQRHAFARDRAGSDPRLLAALLELLDAQRAQGQVEPGGVRIIEQVLRAPDPPEAPDRIGPYLIRRVIGQGGMGEVYLAEQENPQREVALKIVRRGAFSANMQARFAREIRVLGRLEHPGITRIYEAGTARTEQGPVAYFAMEYVQGRRLTEAVTELNLDVAARVELVAKLADAVQHAHTKAVIHRDLKPANILVENRSAHSSAGTASHATPAGPQPKILDFGVARLLGNEDQQTAVTEAGLVIGTIGYMSPEQLAGDADSVDARTDVYAMGVILYELIAGRLPHELRDKPLAEAARIVRDEAPEALSTRQRHVDRDLETIVQRAMAKDRERRYPTATALADDLRRYLRDEPIMARPPTAAYQLTKFARRNRGLVSGFAVAAMTVLVALAVSTMLYLREQEARKRADANAVAAQLARDRADAQTRLSDAVREYMIEGLLLSAAPDRKGYDVKVIDVLTSASEGLHGRFADHPEVEGEIRSDLGDVLRLIGKFKEGQTELLASLPLLERATGPDSAESIRALQRLCNLYQDTHQDQPWLDAARELHTRLRRSMPDDPEAQVRANLELGAALTTMSRFDEARAALSEGLVIAEKDPARHADQLPALLNWLGTIEIAVGNTEAVLDLRLRALDAIRARFGPEHENTLIARSNVAAELLRLRRFQEAFEFAQGVPEAMEKRFPAGHPMRSNMYSVYGVILVSLERYAEAEKYLADAYESYAAAAKDFDWMTERAIGRLAQLYGRWEGHAEQHREWSLERIKARLMLSGPDELSSITTVIGKFMDEHQNTGVPISRAGVLDQVWERRDRFAPEGHGKRATFYANFARASVAENHLAHVDDAIALAEASMPPAPDDSIPQQLLAKARAERPSPSPRDGP